MVGCRRLGKEKGSFSSLKVKVAKEDRVVSSDDAVLVAAGGGASVVAVEEEAAKLQPRTTA